MDTGGKKKIIEMGELEKRSGSYMYVLYIVLKKETRKKKKEILLVL